MKQFKFGAIPCSLLCAFLLMGSVIPLAFTSCGKDPSEPDIPGKLVKVDSRKLTIDGKTVEDEVNCDFNFDGAGESSCLHLILNKAGKWKVNINTHFGNVGYNFVATINAK